MSGLAKQKNAGLFTVGFMLSAIIIFSGVCRTAAI